MNRRTFIKTGSIALATTAVAGCIGDSGGVGSDSNNPDIDVTIVTSDAFDDLAEHEEPEVSIEDSDEYEEDDEEHVVIEYLLEPTDDECADVTADITAHDDDGAVIDEYDARDQFDPGEAYRVKHTVREPPGDVAEVHIELTVNTLSSKCFA